MCVVATQLRRDELQTSDGAVLPRFPSKRDQAGYIRHPAAAAAHRASSSAVQLQQERADVLFRKSCSEQMISNRSDVPPHRARTSPSSFPSADMDELVMSMEKYRLVPPLSAPTSQVHCTSHIDSLTSRLMLTETRRRKHSGPQVQNAPRIVFNKYSTSS